MLREPIPPGVRPTAARVREAVFSILGDLDGLTFLDAFGGAGLMGLEAWSRGAEVTVVERDRRAAASIARRGAEVEAAWAVRTGDVLALAPRLGTFDVVFADPPYAMAAGPVVEALAPLCRGWLIVESAAQPAWVPQVGRLALDRVRNYGGTVVAVYRGRE